MRSRLIKIWLTKLTGNWFQYALNRSVQPGKTARAVSHGKIKSIVLIRTCKPFARKRTNGMKLARTQGGTRVSGKWVCHWSAVPSASLRNRPLTAGCGKRLGMSLFTQCSSDWLAGRPTDRHCWRDHALIMTPA